MATVDQRNGKWRAQVRRKGLGSVSRSFILKADALAWARQTEAAIERGSYDPAPKEAPDTKAVTLAQLLSRYKNEVSAKKKGAKNEGYIIDAFIQTPLAKKKLSSVTSSDWAKYRDERLKDIKPKSLQRQIAIFKNCYELSRKEWGYTKLVNALADVSLPNVDVKCRRRLKEGEIELIVAEAKRRRNPIVLQVILWAKETGMRRGEILAMRWQDVSLKDRVLNIPNSKNGLSRQLPVTTAMLSLLEACDPDQEQVFPIAEKNLKSTVDRILKAVGLSGDLHFHDLRREAISTLFEKGLAIQEVASISGHQDWKMLKRYTAPRPADILRKLELVKA